MESLLHDVAHLIALTIQAIQACAALGAVGTAGDAGVLGPALEDADPWVVLHAARSLKALGGPALLERTAAGHDAAGLLVRQVLAE